MVILNRKLKNVHKTTQ